MLSPKCSQKRRGVTKPNREGVAGTTIGVYFSLSRGFIEHSSFFCFFLPDPVDFFSSKQESISFSSRDNSETAEE